MRNNNYEREPEVTPADKFVEGVSRFTAVFIIVNTVIVIGSVIYNHCAYKRDNKSSDDII